jgi:type 1 fimbria pilin
MGKAMIVQFKAVGAGSPKQALDLGVVHKDGLAPDVISTSASVVNTDLDSDTVAVLISAETAIRVDVGVGVTADEDNSLKIAADASRSFAIPVGSPETWRVSIIDPA